MSHSAEDVAGTAGMRGGGRDESEFEVPVGTSESLGALWHLESDAGGIVGWGVFSTELQKSPGSDRVPQGGQKRKGGL